MPTPDPKLPAAQPPYQGRRSLDPMIAALILSHNSRNMQSTGIHKSDAIVDDAIDLAIRLQEGIARREGNDDLRLADAQSQIEDQGVELAALTSQVSDLKAQLADAQAQIAKLSPPAPAAPAPVPPVADAGAAKSA